MQFSDLNLNKTYSYADYLKWTFEERIEIIKGKAYKMTFDEYVEKEALPDIIFNEFSRYLKDKSGKIHFVPFNIQVTDSKILSSEFYIEYNQLQLNESTNVTTPNIVIAFISSTNGKVILQNKYELYEQLGIPEYWIISATHKSFFRYTLTDGTYQPSRLMTMGDIITTPILPGFELNLETVFAGV